MNLTEESGFTTWPEAYYVFIEKVGPFYKTAPEAWQEIRRLGSRIAERNKITGRLSLYKVGEKIYRAGCMMASEPRDLPSEMQSTVLGGGGKYKRFVLVGPYSLMPQASARVWEIVAQKELPVRDDFAIEFYANDPMTTPEDELITEILVPVAG